jgi:hypothetical protein
LPLGAGKGEGRIAYCLKYGATEGRREREKKRLFVYCERRELSKRLTAR